jgi:hypothetical protein
MKDYQEQLRWMNPGNYLFGKFTLDTKTKVLKWDNDFIDLSKRREFYYFSLC